MNPGAVFARLAAMDGPELRFRSVCEARKIAGRLRFAAARPAWHRRDLVRLLDPAAGPLVREARAACRRGAHAAAQAALVQHFGARAPRWPLAAATRDILVSAIRSRFPAATEDVRDRADSILAGRFHLMGYPNLELGFPPDWHADAVNGRRAPRGYWASVPFLDPASGDHKVIWELNRHQHFLTLGAAFWLTDDLRYRRAFVTQLEDWLHANPPFDGVNWTSMLELAFRTLSWTWAIEFFCRHGADDERPWLVDLLVALDRQMAHIEHNLSTYFSPNTHLTGEALALYAVSSALPELTSSRTRVQRGREILVREATRQVRADGGHAELSSHYHRYSTDFYLLALLVARRTNDPVASRFEALLRDQARYLRTIADDQGRLPHLGDDDGGQLFRFGAPQSSDAAATLSAAAAALRDTTLAVTPPDLDVYWTLGETPAVEQAPGVPPAPWPTRLLADSGYFVSRASGGHLVFDAGPHGFLNGGHAHADALAVILTVAGEPVFVDPGTGTYTMDRAARDRFRSTAMHNTVTVDGRASAEPRGPFHWVRQTDARMLVARTAPDGDFAVGAHDGYGFPHYRAVAVVGDAGWLIVDHLTPPHTVRIDAWWHVAPGWTATAIDAGFTLAHTSGRRLAIATTAIEREVMPSAVSPEYGRIEPATALRMSLVAAGPVGFATFVPSRFAGGTPRLTLVELNSAVGPGWRSCTFALSAGDDIVITLAFPVKLQARQPEDWPQPCIRQTRSVCVE